ncbi:hypothetical protein [Ferribacterium limneticum]|uniref:hypothetical protein n=1 Tax=Ferribacterium limneticum TaxID=76259 RepID=UPI001CFBC625|nr:hypothetical protein [Ferribacterium limneticum]UCV28471.1 hypothetical protein KI617_19890 [Ferribacterium limneticum]UCV32388.1 hypothetical protein KI608_19890 [Ferribacterium limneticum]
MSNSKNAGPLSAIAEAIRAKRERKSGTAQDIEELEASLLADIENFDLDAAERRAKREYLANSGAGMADPTLVFPEIAPGKTATFSPEKPAPVAQDTPVAPPVINPEAGTSLLDQLRQQAEVRQREIHSALAERTSTNEAIDQALKHLFFYLHELVQQLNIVKPGIPRDYPLIEKYVLNRLEWQEGFADYRTQSQSAGALVELVTFSYHLKGPGSLCIERDGPSVERFRTTLFDFGLPFTCKEFKNERSYVERAEFDIRSDVSVSARWRADFSKGVILLETRNLERLGSAVFTVNPHFVDQALLDDFGRLVLGQPNRFRELAKR